MDSGSPRPPAKIGPRPPALAAAIEILERLPHGVWLGNPSTGELVFANRRMMELLGPRGSRWMSQPPFLPLVPEEEHARLRRAMKEGAVVEHRIQGPEGQWKWVRHHILPAPGGPDGSFHLMGVMEELAVTASGSALNSTSGAPALSLPGRGFLLTQVAVELASSPSSTSALLVLDVDGVFTTGQPLGDDVVANVMIELTARVRHVVRGDDRVALLKPGVLGILLAGVGSPDIARQVAQRVRTAVEEPLVVGSHRALPIASAGIAIPDPTGDTAPRLLADAEIAVRQASKKLPTRVVVLDQNDRKTLHRRIQLQNDLRLAIENGDIQVYYQPIYSSSTDSVAGVEALARWHHPTRGFVSPGEFIPLAEEIGIIGQLDTLVMSKACHQVARWNTLNLSGRELFVSVNLSAAEVVDPALVSRVLKVIKKTGISPGALKLEVTESVLVEYPHMANKVMRALESRGVCFSLDDFGTGYSALSYLHRYRFRTLKIDRSFINRMNDGARNAALVRSIVVLARTMGMDVVAEGVETLEQMKTLGEMGCDYMQGFYLARPMPGSAFAQILSSQMDACPRRAA